MKSWVYILQCKQFFKIGYTTQGPQKRLKTMTGNPFPIVLIGYISFSSEATGPNVEAELHRQYKAKRKQGEWFCLTTDDIKAILEKFKDNSTLVNEPIPHEKDPAFDPKKDYWKVRFLKHKDAIQEEQKKCAEALRYKEQRYKRLQAFIEKKDKEIERLKNVNKKLRKDIKDVGKLTEQHTLTQIIEQLEFIKKAVQ